MCASGPLELTLAIIKPHVIKAPHALEVSKNNVELQIQGTFIVKLKKMIRYF